MKNLMLLAALAAACLLGHAHAAEPPTVDDLIVVYNTGGFVNPYLKGGYKNFFEQAEQHDFVMIHNFVYFKPMQFAQTSWLKAVYPKEPISNFAEFGKYGRKREKWWAVYVGSPETFKLIPGETDKQWLSRAIDELRPIIEARPDAIVFDAFQEADQIRYLMLISRLRNTYKIELIFEPARYRDATELADWPVATQTEYFENRAGISGWDTGKNKLRPLVPPSEQPWAIELLRGSDVNGEIANARQNNRVPAVNIAKLKEAG